MTATECRPGGRYCAAERGAYEIPAQPENGTEGADWAEGATSAHRPAGFQLVDLAHIDPSVYELYARLPRTRMTA